MKFKGLNDGIAFLSCGFIINAVLIAIIEIISDGLDFFNIVLFLFAFTASVFIFSSCFKNFILLEDNKIKVVCGFRKTEVNCNSIISNEKMSVFKVRALPFRSYTLSGTKYIIRYDKYNYIIISVTDIVGFTEKLKGLNPNIKVDLHSNIYKA